MTLIQSDFAAAVQSRERVSGFTHNYYRYPARFSPLFVRAAIETFTKPGDVVMDPFMGGGTSLVEACAHGRRAIGTDINALSVFVAKVKTTVMTNHDLNEIRDWAQATARGINLHRPAVRDEAWATNGYHRNIDGKTTWPIRKLLEMALPTIGEQLSSDFQRRFARCALLKTAQWALDCKKDIPSAGEFRQQLLKHIDVMCQGATEYAEATCATAGGRRELATCLHCSAADLHSNPVINDWSSPKLVVTSPPYPGVHVLYHRWQVQGRRETPAPYWIAAARDGDGASFYNFGDRHQLGLAAYYTAARAAFSSLATILSKETLVVQMIAFSDPSWQLPEYLETMNESGLAEHKIPRLANASDGRLWREIPNRKFYADQKGKIMSSKEVVLFHRLK